MGTRDQGHSITKCDWYYRLRGRSQMREHTEVPQGSIAVADIESGYCCEEPKARDCIVCARSISALREHGLMPYGLKLAKNLGITFFVGTQNRVVIYQSRSLELLLGQAALFR